MPDPQEQSHQYKQGLPVQKQQQSHKDRVRFGKESFVPSMPQAQANLFRLLSFLFTLIVCTAAFTIGVVAFFITLNPFTFLAIVVPMFFFFDRITAPLFPGRDAKSGFFFQIIELFLKRKLPPM